MLAVGIGIFGLKSACSPFLWLEIVAFDSLWPNLTHLDCVDRGKPPHFVPSLANKAPLRDRHRSIMRAATAIIALIAASSLKTASSFSPCAMPLTRSCPGATCSLRLNIPVNAVHGASRTRHLTPMSSGKASSNAEQADLNFKLWDAAKNGEADQIPRCCSPCLSLSKHSNRASHTFGSHGHWIAATEIGCTFFTCLLHTHEKKKKIAVYVHRRRRRRGGLVQHHTVAYLPLAWRLYSSFTAHPSCAMFTSTHETTCINVFCERTHSQSSAQSCKKNCTSRSMELWAYGPVSVKSDRTKAASDWPVARVILFTDP
jgi:hypothetical protein